MEKKVIMALARDLKRGKYWKFVAMLHPSCHQVSNRTTLNRYPEIFATVAAVAPGARRILSYGCSTGEECVSLADYFPEAQIIGADINPLGLLEARKRRSDRIRFVYASDRILKGYGGFDAVFCMSVLRSSQRKRLAGKYPFDRFAERTRFLESLVKPGGFLVIHNSSYRFGDTQRQYAYEIIPVVADRDEIFLPDGVTETEADGSIFRKLP